MPVINISGPKMSLEQKRQLVKEYTEIGSKITGSPEATFTVLINEFEPANVGGAGMLLVDRKK
jgi:4-oxalocrotonate tautomerase